jgi:hypothetical protein
MGLVSHLVGFISCCLKFRAQPLVIFFQPLVTLKGVTHCALVFLVGPVSLYPHVLAGALKVGVSLAQPLGALALDSIRPFEECRVFGKYLVPLSMLHHFHQFAFRPIHHAPPFGVSGRRLGFLGTLQGEAMGPIGPSSVSRTAPHLLHHSTPISTVVLLDE